MNKKTIFLIILFLPVFLLSACNKSASVPEPEALSNLKEVNSKEADNQNNLVQEEKENEIMNDVKAPAMQIDSKKVYSAVLSTSEGDIAIALHADKTPVTVNNFVYLANKGFYDSTIFHRVINGFMIQGGDPEGTGRGGPGYRFDDEPFEGEYKAGVLAMANAGPNTNGSQFFIMHKDYPLPKNYVIFANVTKGMEVVDKIATAPTSVGAGGEKSTPISPVTVKSVKVTEK